MQIDRSTRIYAITFISLTFFLLILTIITHFPYEKRQHAYNATLINYLIPDGSYVEHQLNVDTIIKRALLVRREVLASQYASVSSEQEELIEEYMILLVLYVEQYGIPIKIVAKYNLRGELQAFMLIDDTVMQRSLLLKRNFDQKMLGKLHMKTAEFFDGNQYEPIKIALRHGENFIINEMREAL
ncbi:hypothetical protein PVA44_06190 [Entomospira nematocerorum]|uniref:Uncharacterized protein n=1 Tax=Entomospira nematocerorum TaxID=2719987 RepID=A0A968GDP1_9SPIO|nr:hypothetical protein [Entomospira nematocera]NIZ46390.1 hypothetical protein [Entomospira nematocera]WDI33806.1 hypothetical protein PVA44_06190 [Entomospira nematocera]